MELYELLFFIAFLGMLGIMTTKLLNMFNGFTGKDFKQAMILFILGVIAWGITLFINIVYYDSDIIRVMFLFGTGIFLVNTLFFIVEVVKNVADAGQRARYTPR